MPRTFQRSTRNRGQRWEERHKKYRRGGRGRGRRQRARDATAGLDPERRTP